MPLLRTKLAPTQNSMSGMPALMKRNVLGGALFLDIFGIKGAMISFQSCDVMMMCNFLHPLTQHK
eukprot:scaffold1335_cov282-Chaetoceros_neogracile.AAC.7